ncbi:MAG: hypothetical protein IJW40_11460 [Clostridia bacterium]|nr:hypothetical protein [Clostridia bacterium]
MSIFKKLFGLDRPAQSNNEFTALLTTVYSNEELVAVRSLLNGMNIPHNWADRGAGGVTRIVMGNTSYGTDVFVHPDQLEDAKALLFPDLSDEELAAMSENAADADKTETETTDKDI